MRLRAVGPEEAAVRLPRRRRAGFSHCQNVSVLSSRSSSTPLPGLADEQDHTAASPSSRFEAEGSGASPLVNVRPAAAAAAMAATRAAAATAGSAIAPREA